ncbi:MAG: amidohydrolase, partial [Candidatus Eremiobacteraeota bacterium]|nr:amidohydrolase [Candidatus Eremiobacteraeota bacterium]
HDALTKAFPDRPVLLERVDGHAVLANAKAMQLAGITKTTTDPSGGRILRDANGNPTGVFIDNAMSLVYRAVPAPTAEQYLRALRSAIGEAHRWGLTTVSDPGAGTGQIAAYEQLGSGGGLSLRSYVMLADNAELLNAWFQRAPLRGAYHDRLWIASVKMFADGALGSRGAALLEPYSDDPSNTGLMRITGEHITDVATRALQHEFQVCTHAIGDRANRTVLDSYEAALKRVPRKNARMRIEHAQVLAPQDIPRFAQLGILPSMQTTHQISDMRWAQARLGPERIRGAYAWRSLLDTGIVIANGTDAPVESVNTLRTFHSAISRQDELDQPPGGWYSNQRMTREEALKSMTIWAAHANFQERMLGSLTPGKYADFVVMSEDWMRASPQTIMNTNVVATYSSGRRVFDIHTVPAMGVFRPRAPRNGACCGHA